MSKIHHQKIMFDLQERMKLDRITFDEGKIGGHKYEKVSYCGLL